MGARRSIFVLHPLWLAVAFAAVSSAFVLASFFADRALGGIETETENILRNALAGLEHLAAARTELRHFEAMTDTLAEGPSSTRAASLEASKHARAAVDLELHAYFEPPFYPGERELFVAEIPRRLARIDAAAERIVAALDDGEFEDARRDVDQEVREEVEALDRVLKELMDLNRVEVEAATTRIDEARRVSGRLAVGLDSTAGVFAIIAAIITVRGARRYTQVMKRNTDLQRVRADELETFAQRVAHDLLSPLTAVSFALGLIERRAADAEIQGAASRAQRSLTRSRDLVQGIFEFARSGSRPDRDARTSVSGAIERAIEGLSASPDDAPPEVSIESFDDCDLACAAPVLDAMLSNLLTNASKYTKDSPERRIVVRVAVTQSRARIEVDDTGPGVPRGLEEAIFEPYVRGPATIQPGLGLGLATVKRFAIAHGGSVGVVRRAVGSTFWFELPRWNGAKDAADDVAENGAPASADHDELH